MARPVLTDPDHVQCLSDAAQLAITNNAPGAALDLHAAPGTYRIIASKACRFLQGGSSVAMSDNSTKGNPLPANTFFPERIVVTGAADGYFTARTSVGAETGVLEFIKETC